jgi:hypothetical protein
MDLYGYHQGGEETAGGDLVHNEIERLIYAAAYAAEFNRLHDLGVHAEFRRLAAVGEIRHEDVVRLWEENCADCAIDHAEALVRLHRVGLRVRKARGCT